MDQTYLIFLAVIKKTNLPNLLKITKKNKSCLEKSLGYDTPERSVRPGSCELVILNFLEQLHQDSLMRLIYAVL